MAKKQDRRPKAEDRSNTIATAVPLTARNSQLAAFLPYVLLFTLACAIYANTLQNKYASDDSIVLTENIYTKQGFKGIPELLTRDAFEGFFKEKKSLVGGGRYRPLSMVSFAIEYELYGLEPAYSHALNVLFFALTCVLLFHILLILFPARSDLPVWFGVPFIASLLFTVHPIHTEAVANIKGRDEIFALLFSLLSLLASLKYVRTKNTLHIAWGALAFFFGMMSKENTITFLAIIPFAFWCFTTAKAKDYIITLMPYVVGAVIFLALRHQYAAADMGFESKEILNNPFAFATSEERLATTVLTWLLYIKLLFFPLTLSHDYYFNQIPMVGFGDLFVLLSLLVNVGLFVYALLLLRRKDALGFALLFYFATFSVVSNLLFSVGALMNERFIYMSSIGFCIALASLFEKTVKRFSIPRIAHAIVIGIVCVLFSAKTIARNPAWKDNFKLFETDSRSAPNSAKVRTSYGGNLYEKADTTKDETEKQRLLALSISELQTALKIYPQNFNALYLLGNALYAQTKDVSKALPFYQQVIANGNGQYYGYYHMADVQRKAALFADAKTNYANALRYKTQDFAAAYYAGFCFEQARVGDSAIIYFNYALQLQPNSVDCIYHLGTTHGKVLGNLNKAIPYLEKASSLRPNEKLYLEDLAVAYGMSNRYDDAINACNKLLQLDPNYGPAYMNLAVSYRNKGDMAKFNEYIGKFQQIGGK